MNDQRSKRYLAIVQLKSDSTLQRIAADVPQIIGVFSRLSRGEQEQAFRSKDGLLFGIFLKTSAHGGTIKIEFEVCGHSERRFSIGL